jgi:hypothetical protein
VDKISVECMIVSKSYLDVKKVSLMDKICIININAKDFHQEHKRTVVCGKVGIRISRHVMCKLYFEVISL